jgi:hypothetical protein
MSFAAFISALNGTGSGETGGGGGTIDDCTPGAGGVITDPASLAWNKIHEERYFSVLDENFMLYSSNFGAGTSEYTTVAGTPFSIASGQMQVINTTAIRTNVAPPAAWMCVELNVAAFGTTGGLNRIGPAWIQNAGNYITAQYDPSSNAAMIVQNGAILVTKTLTTPLNTTNVTLYMVIAGQSCTMWAKQAGAYLLLCHTVLSYDMTYNTAFPNYYFGIYANATSTQTINSLRAGVSGGNGFLNLRLVKNDDGSPYEYDSLHWLFTADLGTTSVKGDAWTQCNSTVFSLDRSTFAVNTVGRLFFNRSVTFDSSNRTLGGQDIKLTWFASLNQWLLVYVYADGISTSQIQQNDSYAWLTPSEPFGLTVINESRLLDYGLTATNGIYDSAVYKIGSTWYVLASESDQPIPAYSSLSKTILFSGSSLSSLTTVNRTDATYFQELPTMGMVGGIRYVFGWSFGDTKGTIMSFPNLTTLGLLDFPLVTSGYIPGYDLGYTDNCLYLVGFDTQEYSKTNQSGETTSFPWSVGRLVIYRASKTAL